MSGLEFAYVAEVILELDAEQRLRGSGYRVSPGAVLTAAHVVEDAMSVRVRFNAAQPSEWSTEAIPCWVDHHSDLAVLSIAPREGEKTVPVARFGRISDRPEKLTVHMVGFPRFKLKNYRVDDSTSYDDSHQADGSISVLSNRLTGTLEVTVLPPERDPDPAVSPWAGMSGAVVWMGDRIVGVITEHHRPDGVGRLTAARLDRALDRLDPDRRAELPTLLDLPKVLPDVVPPTVSERVTIAYQAQVREIAPECLLDRDAELDELADFCAGDQPYAWWQAEPWAGKSALMSWFVLHPPAELDVVSFFITARLVEQSDSDACISALTEQLAALVGEPPAGLQTGCAQRGTMLRLLDDAASRAREVRRRLLLVIDGLDEDRSADNGRPSIAALLPRRPPPGVRILIASRPHPPIPHDVVEDHLLRTVTPRQLDVSEHACERERLALLELTTLLNSSTLERDVLGLITAAGGGLTRCDLEELTKQPRYEIERLLVGLLGRSVQPWTRSAGDEHPAERVYLFAHETLLHVAEQQYGTRLIAYRDQLHRWADTYRQQTWPTETPRYLLNGYSRLLTSTRDLARLIACATDRARHDRMRIFTGGDGLALKEISTAQQLLLAQSDLDLTYLALIAVQRKHVTERNKDVPVELPAVWARLGQPTRAEALANGIPDPYQVVAAQSDKGQAERLADEIKEIAGEITNRENRETALELLAEATIAAGKHDPAEALTAQITETHRQPRALCRLAEAMAAFGNYQQAEVLAAQIADLDWEIAALTQIAKAMAAAGNHDLASRLVDKAERLLGQFEWPGERALALAELAEAVAVIGNRNRASRLATRAERIVRRSSELDIRTTLIPCLAKAAAANGDHRRAARLGSEAETLLMQITDPADREMLLSTLAEANTIAGNHDRAEALIGEIPYDSWRAKNLARLADAAAAGGHHERATRLANESEVLIMKANNRGRQLAALARLTEAVTAIGKHDRAKQLADKAERLISRISDPGERVWPMARLAEAVAVTGDYDRVARLVGEGEKLSSHIPEPMRRVTALAQLTKALAIIGNYDRVNQLTDEAEKLTRSITHAVDRDWALSQLAEAVDAAGDGGDQAEAFIRQVTDQGRQIYTLVPLAESAAATGDHDRAARLAGEAIALGAQCADSPFWSDELMQRAQAVDAAIGSDHAKAAKLIGQVTERYQRDPALIQLSRTMATVGDHDQARAFARQISDPDQQAGALARLAVVAMGTSREAAPAAQQRCGNSLPLVAHARQLLGEALVTGSWTEVVAGLARVDPSTVVTLAEQLNNYSLV